MLIIISERIGKLLDVDFRILQKLLGFNYFPSMDILMKWVTGKVFHRAAQGGERNVQL